MLKLETQKSAKASGLRYRAKKGFTLLELVVVLTVLVALAGILLPTLPNLLQRSHAAVCSTNIPELNKAMLTYNTLQRQFPNNFDNLVSGETDNIVGLPDEGEDLAPNLDVGTLTGAEIEGLNRQGITHVIVPVWADNDPTFEAHAFGEGIRTQIVDSTDVMLADSEHILEVLGVGTGADEKFVVFGVGQQSTIVGELDGGIFEAPVHFDDGGNTPDVAYSRYVVVFQVADEDGNPLRRARFVGASALHDDGLENVNDHIAEFYEL